MVEIEKSSQQLKGESEGEKSKNEMVSLVAYSSRGATDRNQKPQLLGGLWKNIINDNMDTLTSIQGK